MLFGAMERATVTGIPQHALRRLEFLAGEYAGTQTMYPPDGGRVSSAAFCTISREACERFLKFEFFAEVEQYGIESFTCFVTFSTKKELYEMWLFSSSSEEPLHMVGDFKGSDLVFISDPWSMPWGLQRLKGTFTPDDEGNFRYVAELWEPDGYSLFRSTSFQRRALDF